MGDILATSVANVFVTKPKDLNEPEKMTLGGKLKGPSHSGGGIPMEVVEIRKLKVANMLLKK